MSRALFQGHVVGSWPMTRKKLHRIIIIIMIMNLNLYSVKTIEEYSKGLYINLSFKKELFQQIKSFL